MAEKYKKVNAENLSSNYYKMMERLLGHLNEEETIVAISVVADTDSLEEFEE
jgi:uncharacterized protein YdaL